ncbi:MAG: bifunctional UDP-N-acetylmuramoyl-tripeptide:D-alanyl-D-alanine ligase/alanine racemase [Bacteroidales bacterium]
MNFTSSRIAEITGGSLEGPGGLAVTELITDSRQTSFTDNAAFIAIRGKNHDGHLFIEPLYRKGIRVFIVSSRPGGIFNDAAFIITPDTVGALQMLATFKRASVSTKVIAVTGSTGKTIVKEWLADILGRTTPVVRSPKSYNSQIGVPLSVWKLDDKFRYGIIEAGISQPGEMEKLRMIIRPDTGIITNIGDAHGENFRDAEDKAREKLLLFADASMIIFCRDQRLVRDLILNDPDLKFRKLIDWSLRDREASVYVKCRRGTWNHTVLEIHHGGTTTEAEIPFTDRASVENAITVAAACLALGTDMDLVRNGLAGLTSVAMRMELKSGINNCYLIEDYYNSDPGSLRMAIEFLRSQNNRNSTLILSDFVESGRNERELYGEVADLVIKTGIDKFIGIGPALKRNSSLFGVRARFFDSTDDVIRNLATLGFSNEMILLKGARVFELEKIGKLLEHQIHTTVLEINLDAISHNLNEIRRNLNDGTRIMAMVKAFAYGAGPAEIAGILEYHRISYLGVAYADEGVELRNAGVSIPLMIMNPDPSAAELMIRYNLEPELYSFSTLETFARTASRHGLYQYPVHLKIDSGMHRLGFMHEDIGMLISRVKEFDSIKVASVFSHLAASDDPSLDRFTHHQAEVFIRAAGNLREALGYPIIRHLLNTSGIARFPEYQFEMVRPGIGIYGAGTYEGLTLKPASRFRTRISQIKRIPPGEPVGYGCADVSEKEREIAILPVGYADGLRRKLGNRNGNLFIGGRRVPLIGNICMDMCMADVTGLAAGEGDEAEIFGEHISIEELAAQCETIPYEILTSIAARVKRVFFRE